MNKNRLEAFSDGVFAIIITIMVLEIKMPNEAHFTSLVPMLPVFLSYILSFVNVGIYWNNHHHMIQVTKKINGTILWANIHLLFWLSLMPSATSWIGTQHFAPVPMCCYGIVLTMCAIAYILLQNRIIQLEGKESLLYYAVQNDWKGKISLLCYFLAIPLAFVSTWISGILYCSVAILWIVPDKRIENQIDKK